MNYIIKKPYWFVIRRFRNRAVKVSEIGEYLREMGLDKDERNIIKYLVERGFADRIVKDIYYISDPFERHRAEKELILGLNKAGVRWYFGLFSAWYNGRVSNEIYTEIVIVNDTYSGKRKLGKRKNGINVHYVKTKRDEMYEFGLERTVDGSYYSDAEKTLLDAIYFSSYGVVSTSMLPEMMSVYFDPYNSLLYVGESRGPNPRKLKEYLSYYPDFVRADFYSLVKYWGIDRVYPEVATIFETDSINNGVSNEREA